MFNWFINDEEALRLWTVGGTPNGTYIRALEVLSDLYQAHKEDLTNEELTPNGTKYKDLYLKMMLALSLTHSSNVGLWIGGNQFSDAVTRYEIYKDMHLNNKLLSNNMFENYTVEEMRWVMHVNIDDEEIKWLRDYSYKRYPDATQRFSPYSYVRYTTGYSYHRPQYYSAENYEKWNQKYNLSAYNITYQYGKPKLWIVFEEGAVCGGISKTAANLYGVWGVPASVVGQPGHAAYIYYYDVNGKGAWQLSYNVVATGWANTSGYTRMPNDWGNLNSGVVTNGATIKSASYFFLAQEAQNEYEKYEKAKLITLLADVYKDDCAKLEEIYRDTLDVEIINWDAWLGLVNLYITDEAKTEADLISLAEEIASTLTYHPLPMYDLTRRIGTKITLSEYKGRLMIIQNRTLRQATKATGANTLQYKEVPVVASALLGEINSEIATFSFNGTNANKIVLSKQLQSTQVNWEYSLDGGNLWNPVHEHSVTLSAEEIASINEQDDVKIHINGLPMTEANIYTIDITRRTFPSGKIQINDEENRMIGVTNDMEWTLDLNGEWTSFASSNPVFNGNTRVYVRVTAAGTQLSSNPVYFTFTENNSDDTKWYIQSKNLKVVEVNGTGSGKWAYILDGNVNTAWRSAPGYFPAYVTIKLDEPRYISGLDYVPDKSATNIVGVVYGIAKKVNIYVSMDGTEWELACSKDNLGNNESLKHIDLPEPKKALYVKFECESIYPPMDSATKYKTFTVSVIKLYENVIVNETPRAEVNYNITTATNKNVTAELINETRPITVTNNDGSKTYTFTENGEFTFEFVDENGGKGSVTANVNWIDKTPPQAEVSFSTTELTNEDVVATITFDKENITILSKDIQIAENPDKSKTITFDKNTSYELEFEDKLGNIGTKTITVDWIDKEAPTAELTYSTTNLTDEQVDVTMEPSEEVTILNNEGHATYTFTENGEFTFEFVDKAGNEGTATAIVNWIAKVPEYTLTYSTTELTNKDVIVTLDIEEGYTIVSNNGSNIYTFTENGVYDFEYIDESKNRGVITATVDWIDKDEPVGTVTYSTTNKTNEDVIATLEVNEEVTITSEGGKTHTFTENGEFTFEFVDNAGNEGTAIAKVTWINKNAPVGRITYSTTNKTNQDVIATLEVAEGVTVTSEGGKTHTFTKNGEFIFEFVDNAGNEGTAVARVTWINKDVPEGRITYSTTNKTNQDVIATLEVAEEVTVTSEGGKTHIFTENGKFTFEFVDEYGNKGTAIAEVTWINKDIPEGRITYSTTNKTNQDVIATLEVAEGVTVTSEGGKTYTFTENGEFTFEFVDEYGNEGTAVARVTWINKIAPIGTVTYSITNKTNQDVIATLEVAEGVTVTSEGGKTYIFTENGEFTFEFVDEYGNKGTAIAKVTWIEKENIEDDDKITSDIYEIDDNVIRKLPLDLEVNEFIKNIEAKKEIVIKDKNQNTLTGTSKIGTGMKAYIGNNSYTFVVKADIDGNGTINLTDLAKICLHYIDKETLINEYFEAADLDNNNEITITDVAKIQLLLIK